MDGSDVSSDVEAGLSDITASTTITGGIVNVTGTTSLSGGHTHNIIGHAIQLHGDGVERSAGGSSASSYERTSTTETAGSHSHTINISGSVSGITANTSLNKSYIYGKSTSVQPPAFVVSMWQRIS